MCLTLFGSLLVLLFLPSTPDGFLVYPPQATSLGLVASVSVPISEWFPERRILIDWCFNMGYNLPSSPSQFYNVAIWPVRPKYRRDLWEDPFNYTHSHLLKKYENDALSHRRHPMDFTAGELYQRIEDFLINYGIHETCLLRTVCELSRHPFDDRHRNTVTEVVTFFLTPSLHQGFDETEQLYRQIYEQAEEQGFNGRDCEELYPDCKKDLLIVLTASLSVPVMDLPPQRRIGFDWGFQMNYDMPFDLASFYNVAIWPTRRNVTKRAIAPKIKRRHQFDLTLVEFYRYLELLLESFDYHKSCLLLCICELIQQPFESHFITELLNFLLRPSLHLDYLREYRPSEIDPYTEAETRGAQNQSCSKFYNLCDPSPLSVFSTILIH